MQTVTVLLPPFQYGCHLFLFLVCSLWLGTFSTMSNKRGESRHPCLVPDLSGKVFSFYPSNMILAVDFSYMAFIMLTYASSTPTLLSVFIINGCYTLSNAFSASIDMILWLLSFLLFMWCITFIDLKILYHPCIPGMNLTWSWFMVTFLRFYFSLFLERGEWRERNICVCLPLMGTWSATQACVLTGNQTGDTLLRILALNPLSHTSQGWYF